MSFVRSRWTRRALAVALVWTLPLALHASAQSDGGTRAASAAAFVDSVGVQTHSPYMDTAYADHDRVLRAIAALGIRHVRDGVRSGPADEPHRRFLEALGRAGVRLTLGLDVPYDSGERIDEALRLVRERLLPYTAMLEGPNEEDRKLDPGWPERVRSYQQALYERVNADPELRSVPVLAPSLARNENQAALGDLSGLADRANLHAYPGGQPPSRPELGHELAAARAGVKGAPLVVTETGYHDALSQTGGQPPASERAAAAYYPRLFLEHFAAGVRRTFAYELIDEKPEPARADQEQHFGLLRNDFSPKPAAESLRRLLALARGPRPEEGSEDAPSGLDLEVESAVPLRRLVLHRSDGRLLLLIWQTTSVWDREARRDLQPPAVDATVRLGATFGDVELHHVGPASPPSRSLGTSRALTVEVPADTTVALVLGPAGGGFPVPLVRPPRPRRPSAGASPWLGRARREPAVDGDLDRL